MTMTKQVQWISAGAVGLVLLWAITRRKGSTLLGELPTHGRLLFPGRDLRAGSGAANAKMLTGARFPASPVDTTLWDKDSWKRWERMNRTPGRSKVEKAMGRMYVWSPKTKKYHLVPKEKEHLLGERYSFVEPSKTESKQNKKLGPISAVYISDDTCPISCVHNKGKAGTCYGRGGNTCLHWKRVNIKGKGFRNLLTSIGTLKPDSTWRYGVVGDAPGKGDAIDTGKLRSIIDASKKAGAKGYMYTHKPVLAGKHAERNRQVIAEANAYSAAHGHGMTINLSANALEHADRLHSLGIGPVVVVLPKGSQADRTPAGNKIIKCPAQTRGLTCAKCKICMKVRSGIVGLEAHGSRENFTSVLATGEPVVACDVRVKRRDAKKPSGRIIKMSGSYVTRKVVPPGGKVLPGKPCFVYRFTPEGRFERRPFKGEVAPAPAGLVQLRKFTPIKKDMALPVVPEVPTQASAPDPNV